MTDLKSEIKENLDTMRSLSRQLENLVQIVSRTVESDKEETTNNIAMQLILELKKHPLIEKTKFSSMLNGMHKMLYRNAQDKLSAKLAHAKALLDNLNPSKKSK